MMSKDKEKQTRKLRYSKSLLEKFNYEEICNELYDIQCACDDVRYMVEDEDVLISALGDNEEEAYEFQMMFSDLSAKAEKLSEVLNSYELENVSEYFDQFIVGVSDGAGMNYLAWDTVEEDYFRAVAYETDACIEESQKKLMRMKKEDLISCANKVFRIIIAFLDLKYKYDYLSATLDILNDEQRGLLDMVKNIEEAYEQAEDELFIGSRESTKKLDKLLKAIPERMWIE